MSGLQVYQAGGQGVVTAQFPPVEAPRNPTTTDIVSSNGSPYNLLQQWINTVTRNAFIYLGAGVWALDANSTGDVLTLSDTAGTLVTPLAGNIQLAGTANQIADLAGANKITFSLPAAIIAPGSLTTTTFLTATTNITANTGNIVASAGNITATLGNIAASAGSVSAATTVSAGTIVTGGTAVTATTGDVKASAGNLVATLGNLNLNGPASKININAGTASTASTGVTAAMIGGAVTITSTAITASSVILYSRNVLGTVMGNVSITAQAGGSAVLTSDAATETSTFNYLIIN